MDTTKDDGAAPRPFPDEAIWTMLQDAYRKVKKDSDPDDVALYKAFDSKDNGFKVPVEIRYSPGKGRGLFCTEFVPKGSFVNEARCGHFYTEAQWREFLTSIPHEWAKDCCSWAYVEKHKGKSAVWFDFSEAALMNHAPLRKKKSLLSCRFRRSTDDEKANLDEKMHQGTCYSYATRDIQAGEELLCDYEEFHDFNHPLPWVGSIWDEYWEES